MLTDSRGGNRIRGRRGGSRVGRALPEQRSPAGCNSHVTPRRPVDKDAFFKNSMNIQLSDVWVAAGVLLGFQITSFAWRLSREVKVGESGDLTWLPPADLLNLASMLVTAIGVFALPILGLSTPDLMKDAFGLALLLFVGYPFALAGHYELYSRGTKRSYLYFPRQERVVVAAVVILTAAFAILAAMRYP